MPLLLAAIISLSPTALVIGLFNGLAYGTFAMGIVLFYRASRFVNFLFAELGVLAAAVMAQLVVDNGVPLVLALPLTIGGTALLGAFIELVLMRRFFTAPRLVPTVATIAVSQILLFISLQDFAKPDSQKIVTKGGYPTLFHVSFDLFGYRANGGDLMILLATPVIALSLAAFLKLTPYGQAIRASAENPDAARLAGISVKRMSTLVWMIGGALAASTAILQAPRNSSVLLAGSVGPSLLVRALAAGLIAKMTNLPVAFGAAVGIGILENAVFAGTNDGGITELVIFLIVLGALVYRAKDLSKATRDSGALGTFGSEARALPRRVANLAPMVSLRWFWGTAALVAAFGLPLIPGLDTTERAFLFANCMAFALVGLSLTLLTGWAGQVSLGQFAFLGAGAFTTARVLTGLGAEHWYAAPAALVLSVLLGAGTAVIVGLPAVRIQGLFLGVATLAFGVVATGYFFQDTRLIGDSSSSGVARPDWLSSDRSVYWLGLGLVVIVAFGLRNLRHSGPGRALLAVRDNDRAARADGLSAVGARIAAFALSGGIAGMGGFIYALSTQRFNASSFAASNSYAMLGMVIIGGLGSIPGALLGTSFLYGLPALFANSSDTVKLLGSGAGLIVVLTFLPGGLSGLTSQVRDALGVRFGRRADGLPDPPGLVPPLRDLWAVGRGRAMPIPTIAPAPHIDVNPVPDHQAEEDAIDALAAFAGPPVSTPVPAPVEVLRVPRRRLVAQR